MFFFLIFITMFCAVTFTVISIERLIVIMKMPKGIGDISTIIPTNNMIMHNVEIMIRTIDSLALVMMLSTLSLLNYGLK